VEIFLPDKIVRRGAIMKTLIGHLAGSGVPNLGRAHPSAFPIMGNGSHHDTKIWKTTAPFIPLRQPMGGHGNPRKEHRAA
jgi:hypothetical protein